MVFKELFSYFAGVVIVSSAENFMKAVSEVKKKLKYSF